MRVLEYRDTPGGKTSPHRHPDSVMCTLSGFQRRLHTPHGTRDVVMEPGRAHWLPAQTHAGENIGTTGTHVLFIELKDTTAGVSGVSSGAAAATAHGNVIGPA